MKSKIESAINKQEKELDHQDRDINNDHEIEADENVEAGGPDVASSKGSKIALIAFAAVLIAVVLYFLFFKGGEQAPVDSEGLQPVTNQSDFVSEVPSPKENLEDLDAILGNSISQDRKDSDNIIDTPDVPSIPELPKIFTDKKDDGLLPSLIDLDKETSDQAKDQENTMPDQANQGQDGGLLPATPANQAPDSKTGQSGSSPDNKKSPSSIIVISGAAGPANSVGYEKNIINLNKNAIEDLEVSEPPVKATIIKDKSTTLVQGKIINAILETAINTEFPGEVRGIISRDVFAESGKNVLIPRGSRIYGKYESSVQRGQARVTINWSRLIRPDGVDANITFIAADQFGRAGIEGEIDNKYGSVIANSILTSVLAIGGTIAAEKLSNNKSSTTTTDPTTGTTTTSGSPSGQAIQDLSKTVIDIVGEVIGNTLNMDPIIRVPQGTKITILVNADMDLPEFKK